MSECRCCLKPDNDISVLICGRPLPCPYHTVTIDTTCTPSTVTIPVTSPASHDPSLRESLMDVARALTRRTT